MLVLLAMVDGMQTWTSVQYRPSRRAPPIRGWKFPKMWVAAVHKKEGSGPPAPVDERRGPFDIARDRNPLGKLTGFLKLTYKDLHEADMTLRIVNMNKVRI